MTNPSLFHKEDQTVRHFSKLLRSDQYQNNPLLPELESLLSNYQALLRKLERVTKVSDKQQISLHEMVKTDGLTGVNNRNHLEYFLRLEWKRSLDLQVPLSVIMIDIDYFKVYNDTYGHQAGDNCLVQVANILSASVKRSSDFVARYGGEEFIIVLGDCHPDFAAEIAGSIKSSLTDANIPHEGSDVADRVTLSIGIATQVPDSESSVETLIKRADDALYKAKTQGRNRIISGSEVTQE